MTSRKSLFAVIAGLSLCAVCLAQEAKPWEQPGAEVGDQIIGPDGGKMVWVPAGEFMMGSPEGEGYPDEHPAHKVRITKGFWLGKCPVTMGQWRSYCQALDTRAGGATVVGNDHQAVGLSWYDAKAYCRHYGLTLPTEAQWEYAARGREGREYPWGNEWDPKKCCNDNNRGPDATTFPVGSFPAGASWCGALDMAGSFWQWCNDRWSNRYYADSPDIDPPGPDNGEYRVLRGGSWYIDATYCRSAYRDNGGPSYRCSNVGFRCSRTP